MGLRDDVAAFNGVLAVWGERVLGRRVNRLSGNPGALQQVAQVSHVHRAVLPRCGHVAAVVLAARLRRPDVKNVCRRDVSVKSIDAIAVVSMRIASVAQHSADVSGVVVVVNMHERLASGVFAYSAPTFMPENQVVGGAESLR
jgi:hypothetical protein